MPAAESSVHVRIPTTLVIIGATGALAKNYLYPALLKLRREQMLPADWQLIGIARQKLSNEVFAGSIQEAMQVGAAEQFEQPACDDVISRARYVSIDVRSRGWTDDLAKALAELPKSARPRHTVFYLATAPSLFESIINELGTSGLATRAQGNDPGSSIVVEKPFGHDLDSARQLNTLLGQYFSEDQIYRMDHFLGKDTVQNILAFRFENGLFEPIWNRHYIDHIQLTLAEEDGIGRRGRYYEEAGALRDLIQNHLLQLLAHLAMDPPTDLQAENLRDRRASTLDRLRPLQPSELKHRVVRGQYGPGETMAGVPVKGYLDEEFVADGSTTETFVAMPVELMTERWIGVPFYLRAGLRMPKRVTELTIQFKPSAHDLYHKPAKATANLLTLRIQPNEGIALRLFVKKPGYTKQLDEVDMSFCYRDSFAGNLPQAYDRLLLDCLLKDHSLFARADEIEASWRFANPILDYWQKHRPPEFPNYPAGSWGPSAADDLIKADGRRWWSDRLDVCPIPGAGQAMPVTEPAKKAGLAARKAED